MSTNKKWIVAATHEVACCFAKQNGLHPLEWSYANPVWMEGICDCEVIFVDGYRRNPNADRIEALVSNAKSSGVIAKTGSL